MNIRKNIDYSVMYNAIDGLMKKKLPQMERYCKIGKVVCQRTEKGAAVMAAEYLNKHYPDVSGFSPRNIRRMRDFYRTYENHAKQLKLAMQIGWIQNVVIMEADLTMELREWYMRAARQFGWSKMELVANIATNAHENVSLVNDEEMCYNGDKAESYKEAMCSSVYCIIQKILRYSYGGSSHGKKRRQCVILTARGLLNGIFTVCC